MSVADIRIVVDLWIEQSRELGARPDISYVQIFENRGAMMGASNPHPHCQIWASASVPNEVDREHASQRAYHQRHGRDLLGDYLTLEQQAQERLVCANADFVSLVPFWAVWPFEMLVVPVRRIGALDALTGDERGGLADILKQVTARYDKLFDAPFPYSMGFHTQPFDSETHPEWRVHAHFYPPLLRSATIRKFIVGYELLGTPQRDFTPEHAAERLRAALPAIPNAR